MDKIQTTKANLESDVLWFQDKRDLALERFIVKIKTGESEESIENAYKSLIRIQNQLQVIESIFAKHILTIP